MAEQSTPCLRLVIVLLESFWPLQLLDGTCRVCMPSDCRIVADPGYGPAEGALCPVFSSTEALRPAASVRTRAKQRRQSVSGGFRRVYRGCASDLLPVPLSILHCALVGIPRALLNCISVLLAARIEVSACSVESKRGRDTVRFYSCSSEHCSSVLSKQKSSSQS